MVVKIVTDSTADLPVRVAKELKITVIPAYLRFGNEVYRDRIDISEDQFYDRLINDQTHPTTEPPTPQDFAAVYDDLSRKADGIVSIHISGELSATYNSAIQGKKLVNTDCPIEVVDSRLVTMGLGLLVISAVSIIASEEFPPQIVERIKKVIPNIQELGLFDTLKYLALGGRIGKIKAFLGSVLNVKPMIKMNNGELEPFRQVRNRNDGKDELLKFAKNAGNIQDLSIVYSTIPEEAQDFVKQMGPIFPADQIKLARLGPVLGVHGGPGILFVALRVRSD
ncbi:DegV family protein [Chloroflexota bacterium]